jgi:glycosyltransferase involved in cell wall biosynthesis
MKDLVNFLVRTSGRPNSFKRLLLSIQTQGLENIKIIVSADTDETEAYVRAFPDVDVVVRNQKEEKIDERHAPYNLFMNTLLDAVEEGWVVFVDDDNLFRERGALESVFRETPIEDPSKLYVCRTLNSPGNVTIPSDRTFRKKVTLNDVDTSNLIVHSSIAKKYCWDDQTGGDYRYAAAIIAGEGEGCVEWVDRIVGWMPEGAHRGRGGDTSALPSLCPVCKKESPYMAMGSRPQARCPSCGSFERHRCLSYFLEKYGKRACSRILHIAPEPPLTSALKSLYPKALYETTSYPEKGTSDYCFDISKKIDLESESVDILVCSHVLEHVSDYRAALREIHRVLSPGGSAFIMFPIRRGPTLEDPSIRDPHLRRKLYGQEDHLRFFGLDSVDQIFEGYDFSRHDPFKVGDGFFVFNMALPTICDQIFEIRK